MQLLGIDHVIAATADLEVAAARWEALGLRLTPAMRHDGSSTENRVFFVGGLASEFYVELLAVHDRALARREGRADLVAAVDRGGPYRLMLEVASADEAARELVGHGISVSSREVRRDDGSLIGTVVEPRADTPAGCPFALIEYEGGGEQRRVRHHGAGLFEHDLPLRRLDHLAVIAGDVEGPCWFWHDVLGVDVSGQVSGRGLDIRQLRIGDATLELIGPSGPDSPVVQRPPGLAPVAAFEVSALDDVVEQARQRGFELPDGAPGVLPNSRVSTISADQLGGLALQLIEFT